MVTLRTILLAAFAFNLGADRSFVRILPHGHYGTDAVAGVLTIWAAAELAVLVERCLQHTHDRPGSRSNPR